MIGCRTMGSLLFRRGFWRSRLGSDRHMLYPIIGQWCPMAALSLSFFLKFQTTLLPVMGHNILRIKSIHHDKLHLSALKNFNRYWGFVLVAIGGVLAIIYMRVFRFNTLVQEPKIDVL